MSNLFISFSLRRRAKSSKRACGRARRRELHMVLWSPFPFQLQNLTQTRIMHETYRKLERNIDGVEIARDVLNRELGGTGLLHRLDRREFARLLETELLVGPQ